jgi:type I restriction enzyme R subunit
VFVTWRLGDALPKEVLETILNSRRAWLRMNPPPWDFRKAAEHARLFSQRIDQLLDASIGSCILRNPSAAQIVEDTLRHFHEKQYQLDSYVIMPNHVHVVVRLRPGFKLPIVVKAWKSVSSRKLSVLLGVKPPIWQGEYWDRLVRNQAHLDRCRSYIADNPLKAKLLEGQFLLSTEV